MAEALSARRRRAALLGLMAGLALCALSLYSQFPGCGGYPAWESSPYVLPFPVGEAYPIHQGNCSYGGHRGVYRYSYDFLMPIGSKVTAARAGVVIEILDGAVDGGGYDNWVKVQHADQTIAAYSHLHSLAVGIGDEVAAGDPIGLSGNTGQTGGVPHLHFHATTCSEPVHCGTLPVTFANTDPNPRGLQAGRRYTALGLGAPGPLP